MKKVCLLVLSCSSYSGQWFGLSENKTLTAIAAYIILALEPLQQKKKEIKLSNMYIMYVEKYTASILL